MLCNTWNEVRQWNDKENTRKKEEKIVLMTAYSQLAWTIQFLTLPVWINNRTWRSMIWLPVQMLYPHNLFLSLFFNGFSCVFFVWCWLLGVDVRTRVILNFLIPLTIQNSSAGRYLHVKRDSNHLWSLGQYFQRRQLSPAYLVIMVGFPITTLTIDARSVHHVVTRVFL